MSITHPKYKQVAGVPQYGIPPINEVLEQSKYHISYCWSCRDYGCPTTAIVTKKSQIFIILCGDHRTQLEQFNCLADCITYAKTQKLHQYSESMEDALNDY